MGCRLHQITSALVPCPPFLSIITPRLQFGQMFLCLFCVLLMVFCFKEIQVFLFADGNGGQHMLSLLGQPEGHILWFFVCPVDFL